MLLLHQILWLTTLEGCDYGEQLSLKFTYALVASTSQTFSGIKQTLGTVKELYLFLKIFKPSTCHLELKFIHMSLFFFYCDTKLVPWLKMRQARRLANGTRLVGSTSRKLADLLQNPPAAAATFRKVLNQRPRLSSTRPTDPQIGL